MDHSVAKNQSGLTVLAYTSMDCSQMMKFGVVDNGLLIAMMMAGVNREYTA